MACTLYSKTFRIDYEAAKLVSQIAKQENILESEVINQCIFIGADFLLSPYWGKLIHEYYEQTSSFDWDGFLIWSYEHIK